jgi:hypothetical protein
MACLAIAPSRRLLWPQGLSRPVSRIGFSTPEGSLKREAEFFGCESFAPMSSAHGGETSMLELATMVCEVLPGG